MCFRVLVVGCFMLCAALTSAASAAERRAVLVGINDYQVNDPESNVPESGVRDLSGTHNDVDAMRTLLINRYGFKSDNVLVLKDAQATHAGILQAIRDKLIAPSSRDDVVVFYFSGHGSQMPDAMDASRDESDHWDETIVAYDSRMPGIFDISDDELNHVFTELVARTPNLTVFLDSCHSGTGIRTVQPGTATVRRAARDTRSPPASNLAISARATEGTSELVGLGESYTLISGAMADQLANEAAFNGNQQGALTYHFVSTARTDTGGTYRSVFPSIVTKVNSQFPSQTPQLEGGGMDAPIFGVRDVPVAAWVMVEPEAGNRARVQAGSLYGLRDGVELSIFPPGVEPLKGATLATLKLDDVTTESASGVLKGATTIPVQSRARIDKLPYDGQARRIWLDPSVPAVVQQRLRSLDSEYPSLAFDVANATDADLRVFVRGDLLEIVARDGTVLTRSVDVGAADPATDVIKQLHDWARWRSLEALSNPNSALQVKLNVRAVGAPATSKPPASVSNNTSVNVEIENLSGEPVFFRLLDLSSTGQVQLLHPPVGANDKLVPGLPFKRTLRLGAPSDRASVTDTLKVIASTTGIAGGSFNQSAVRDVLARNTTNPTARMFESEATAVAREAFVFNTNDWTTDQTSIRIERVGPSVGTTGKLVAAPQIALHFATPTDPQAVETALRSGMRTICPGGGENCVSVKPLSSDGTVVEVSSAVLGATRNVAGNNQPVISIGQAFDDAYRAGDSAGALYAEPMLVLDMPGANVADSTGTRGGGNVVDPIAQSDERWSLKYTAVPQAWMLLRQSSGRPEGQEASGVFVAHPDTGYTRNPENWEGATPSAIDTDHDHDYVDNDTDAEDPLLDEGFVENPGHGTGSGSVIVSPLNCQLAGHTQCVSGVAPGARLMPLRVHTSVVLFDMGRLAKAIEDGASGRWGQKADLISIAMGGPPSRTLYKALKFANSQGVLVFAAAGNYVQTVVWPARFKDAIAVSAINPSCNPWRHASHGKAVDIAAPGEGVWRAGTTKPANYNIAMSEGTTFATGTTAGIAALWVAHHRNTPAFANLKAHGEVAYAFRDLAARTAWRPGDATRPPPAGVTCTGADKWKTDEYGAGVINAAALLAAPLPTSAPRLLEPTSLLPLFESLYPPGAAPRAHADYRAIFGYEPLNDVDRFETELLYHYTASIEVRDAVDRLISSMQAGDGSREVRTALLTQDISERMRSALTTP